MDTAYSCLAEVRLQYLDLAFDIAVVACLGYIILLSIGRIDPQAVWLRISMIACAAGVLAFFLLSWLNASAPRWFMPLVVISALGALIVSRAKREPQMPPNLTWIQIGIDSIIARFKSKHTNGEEIG